MATKASQCGAGDRVTQPVACRYDERATPPDWARSFGAVADAYDRGRPTYPARGRRLAGRQRAGRRSSSSAPAPASSPSSWWPSATTCSPPTPTRRCSAVLRRTCPTSARSVAPPRSIPLPDRVGRRGGRRPGLPLVRPRPGAARDRPGAQAAAAGSRWCGTSATSGSRGYAGSGALIGTQDQLARAGRAAACSGAVRLRRGRDVPVLADRRPRRRSRTSSSPAPTSPSSTRRPGGQAGRGAGVLRRLRPRHGRHAAALRHANCFRATVVDRPRAEAPRRRRPGSPGEVRRRPDDEPGLRRHRHRHAAHRLPLSGRARATSCNLAGARWTPPPPQVLRWREPQPLTSPGEIVSEETLSNLQPRGAPVRAAGRARGARQRHGRGLRPRPTPTARRSGPSRPSASTGTRSGTGCSTGTTRRSPSGSSAASSTRRTTASTGTSRPARATGSPIHWVGEPEDDTRDDHLRRAEGRGLPGRQRAASSSASRPATGSRSTCR